MKRAPFVALLLSCCIVFLSIPMSAAAVPSGYTAISTANQLMGITNMSGKYILTADIDLTGKTWVPLGSADAPFTGIFDGNGYVISNLSGKNGLFHTNAGTIQNVTLDTSCTVSYKGGAPYYSYVGSIVGANDGIVQNCINNGTVVTSSIFYIGGICGLNRNTVNGCVNTGSVTATRINTSSSELHVGGICGYMSGTTVTIDQCWNGGAISAKNTTSKPTYAGGISGNCGHSSGNSQHVISNCYNRGTVNTESNSNACAGGIVGQLVADDIRYSYNVGTITVDGKDTYSEYCFAIAGSNVGVNEFSPKGVYTNCYYLDGCYENTGGSVKTGTTACTAAQLRQKSTFSGFDFNNTWMIDGGSSYRYPVLRALHDCSHFYRLTKDTATCTSTGTKTYTCDYCGGTRKEVSPVLDHADKNLDAFCDGCGKDLFVVTVTADQLTFAHMPAGLRLLIAGYTDGRLEALQIPETPSGSVTIEAAVQACPSVTVFFLNEAWAPIRAALPLK